MSSDPEPMMVNRADKLVLYDDNVVRPFDKMFDGDGDETDDPMEALAVTVMVRKDSWHCIDLRDFPIIERVLH